MSSAATTWAWDLYLENQELKLLLLALAEGANHQGQCWPTREMMIRMTGMAESRLPELLRTAADLGYIVREEVPGHPAKVFLQLHATREAPERRARELVVAQPIPLEMSTMMDQAMVIWNEMAKRTKAGPKEHRLSAVQKLTDDMKSKLKVRLKEAGLEGWTFCVLAIEANAHCRGVNDRKWTADFHYLLQAKGFSKTLNGGWPANYQELTNGGQRVGPTGRGDQRQDRVRGFDSAIREHLAERGGREGGGAQRGAEPEVPGRGQGEDGPRLSLGGPDQRE